MRHCSAGGVLSERFFFFFLCSLYSLPKYGIVSLPWTADRHSGIGGGGGGGGGGSSSGGDGGDGGGDHRSWSLLLSGSHDEEASALRGAQCAALATLRLFLSLERYRCGVLSDARLTSSSVPSSPSPATDDAAAREISAGPKETSPDRGESSPTHEGQYHLSGLAKENPSGREENSAAREENIRGPGEGNDYPGRGQASVGVTVGGQGNSGDCGGNVGVGGGGGRASPTEVLMAVRDALLTKTPLLAGLVRCLVGVVASASSGPDGGGCGGVGGAASTGMRDGAVVVRPKGPWF